MAYTPTYEEFERQAKKAGLLEEFSPYDLAIAREDPAYGLTILSAKQGYRASATDAERQYYNDAAERARRDAGNFSGGTDGSGYFALPRTHREGDELRQQLRDYGSGAMAEKVSGALDRLGSWGDFSYDREPDYLAALDAVAEPEPFSYDPASDPVYSSYKKAYTREGRRAAEDTLGQYAALTGGRPSSYAVTASGQAGNLYAAKLADKLPELYEQAYQRYLNEYSLRLQRLNALSGDRKQRYGEYADAYDRLGDYLDRLQSRDDAEYGRLMDYLGAVEAADERNYSRERDLENTRYSREQDALDSALRAEQTAYDREQDALARERQALLDAYDRERAGQSDALSRAKLAASYGDYSGLEALGIAPNAENLRALAIAEAGRTSPVGSGSYRSGSGGTGESGTAGPSYSTSTVNAAYRAFLNGDRSGQTLRILDSAGLLGDLTEDGDGSALGHMDEVLGKMREKGLPWTQLETELEAEYRDGKVSRVQYEGLREKYLSEGFRDGVLNLDTVHRDGRPMSAGFSGVWKTVRDLADRGDKEKALAAMRRALDAGSIHEYEIDVMLDQLGW